MTRFLLALLALFGIVAQSAPAAAVGAGRMDVNGGGVVAAQVLATRAIAACVAQVAAPARPAPTPVRLTLGCGAAQAPLAYRAPSVRIGIDRSAR